jgi:hypothetical protein
MPIQELAGSILCLEMDSQTHCIERFDKTAVANLWFQNILQSQFLIALMALKKSGLFSELKFKSKDAASFGCSFLVLL